MNAARHIPWILTGFDVSQSMLAAHSDRVRRIAEALVEATGCALARPAFAQSAMQKYTKVDDPASLRRGNDELHEAVPPDLTPLPEAVRNIAAEAARLHPGINATTAGTFFAPQVLSQLKANGFMQQASQCRTAPQPAGRSLPWRTSGSSPPNSFN